MTGGGEQRGPAKAFATVTQLIGGYMALLIPLFPIAFAAMWVFIGLQLANIGGWASLAAVYRIDMEDPPGLSRFVSGSLNFVRYKSCLRVASTAEYLYLSVLIVFRIEHPALLIPWADNIGKTPVATAKYNRLNEKGHQIESKRAIFKCLNF